MEILEIGFIELSLEFYSMDKMLKTKFLKTLTIYILLGKRNSFTCIDQHIILYTIDCWRAFCVLYGGPEAGAQ